MRGQGCPFCRELFDLLWRDHGEEIKDEEPDPEWRLMRLAEMMAELAKKLYDLLEQKD